MPRTFTQKGRTFEYADLSELGIARLKRDIRRGHLQMALRIDLHKQYCVRALESAIASLKRSESKGFNPQMQQIIQEDIRLYQHALNTLTEIK